MTGVTSWWVPSFTHLRIAHLQAGLSSSSIKTELLHKVKSWPAQIHDVLNYKSLMTYWDLAHNHTHHSGFWNITSSPHQTMGSDPCRSVLMPNLQRNEPHRLPHLSQSRCYLKVGCLVPAHHPDSFHKKWNKYDEQTRKCKTFLEEVVLSDPLFSKQTFRLASSQKWLR